MVDMINRIIWHCFSWKTTVNRTAYTFMNWWNDDDKLELERRLFYNTTLRSSSALQTELKSRILVPMNWKIESSHVAPSKSWSGPNGLFGSTREEYSWPKSSVQRLCTLQINLPANYFNKYIPLKQALFLPSPA